MSDADQTQSGKPERHVPFGTIWIPDTATELAMSALKSTRVSSGKLVRQFEDSFAEKVGAKHAVALGSGTDADTLALAVLYDFGAERGAEVIVPALSFVATGNSILHAGFTPVFVDIEHDTLNIDPAKIEAAITDRTIAIMPVHLMGKPAEMDTILALAEKHNLKVIEDAAEAYGAEYRGRQVGAMGDLGAFSTYVAHIITTVEGGVTVTDDDGYAEILRSLRSHGRACKCEVCMLNTRGGHCAKRYRNDDLGDIRFIFERVGYSSKMNELEAAVGIGNLEEYDNILGTRRRNLLMFLDNFERFGPHLYTFKEEEHEQIGPHALPIIVHKDAPFSRNDIVLYLENNGIDSRSLFQSMPTQCVGFNFLGYELGQFPEAEFMGTNGFHVGVHQDMTEDDVSYVLGHLDKYLAEHA